MIPQFRTRPAQIRVVGPVLAVGSNLFQLPTMEPKDLKLLTFDDILGVWCSLSKFYGLLVLSRRCNFEMENLRETLMKSSEIWADNWFNLEMVNEVIQVLTIMQTISFKVSMDGESVLMSKDLEASTWIDACQVYPVPKMRGTRTMRSKIFDIVKDSALKELYLKQLEMAIKEAKNVSGLASYSPQIQARFKAIECLLDDVFNVAKA